MKKAKIYAVIVLLVDQLLKTFFQFNFDGKTLQYGEWGFTYVVNKGLWVNPEISKSAIILIQIGVIIFGFFLYYAYKYYCVYYRHSIWMDLSFAFWINALCGNLIFDRFLFGYIRDYFINPIAISNLADLSTGIALIFFIVEIVKFKKARALFRFVGIKDDLNSIKVFFRFIVDDLKHKDRKS